MISFFKTPQNSVIAVQSTNSFAEADVAKLVWLFGEATYVDGESMDGWFVGPRKEMITPWSTNAVEITQNMGITGIFRIEEFVQVPDASAGFDPMLQRMYQGLGQEIFDVKKQPEPILEIEDIAAYNQQEGLALSDDEIAYLDSVAQKMGRKLTDSEVFGFSQVRITSYNVCYTKLLRGETYTRIVPSGPADNHVFAMSFNGADLWLASGGRNAVWNNLFFAAQFQLYREGQWQVFNQLTHPEWGGFHDVLCVAADPASPDHVFAGSWGGGVAEFRNGEFVARYHNLNSSLQTALPNQPNDPYVRISDLDFDSNGNLWVVNSLASKPISVLRPDGKWESFALPGVQSDTDMGQMVITDSDDQWVVVPKGKGLAVRKADGTDARHLSVVAYFNNGTEEVFTPMNNIYAIALDRDGAVWVGTTVGAAVYSRPGDLWSGNTLYATQPGLDQNDGLYHPLLSTETVTAIAVDGANLV